MKTYNELYIATRNTLKRSGIEAYAPEARILVACAAGKSVNINGSKVQLVATQGSISQDYVDGVVNIGGRPQDLNSSTALAEKENFTEYVPGPF